MLYNNEEKETSAGHKNKTEEQFNSTIFTQNTQSRHTEIRIAYSMCFNVLTVKRDVT